MYDWFFRTHSGWLSICKNSIESSTVLRTKLSLMGNYVNRLSDLNWKSCWFLLFCGLLDGYYVAPLLVQTSQVLSVFTCFRLTVTAPSVTFKSRRQATQKTFFMTSRLKLLFKDKTLELLIHEIFNSLLETAFVQRGFYHLENFSSQKANGLVLIELKHIKLLWSLEEWMARQLFCKRTVILFCQVSVLALLGWLCCCYG